MEFETIAVFGRRDTNPDEEFKKLVKFLKSKGRKVILDKRMAAALNEKDGYTFEEMGEIADLAIIYGGDGTMLGVSRKIAKYEVPVIGVNAGHLGFITDITSSAMEKELSEVLDGHYYIDSRRLLGGELYRNGEKIFTGTALNEVCLFRGISGGMVEFKVAVNKLPVCIQRADGIMFSTATGSTAYALSVGGPLISPAVPCILMISVATHTLNDRPVIFAEDSLVEVDALDLKDAALYFDMQEFNEVLQGDKILIKAEDRTLHILHPTSHSFFDTINKKLHWNMMPSTRSTPSKC
ncbi:MAG: NAD(+)/NADH kinase [Burkholderiales bacterium]|nr:NAD(+)/NADH kinase [Burkholderiales bacterium]